MKIVITDWQTVARNDLPIEKLEALGEIKVYNLTSEDQLVERVKDADIALCNKTVFSKEVLEKCDKLKYIGLFATGYNNIDTAFAREKGITVCNAGSYSTNSVAQHTFALLLEHMNQIGNYNKMVADGDWCKSEVFSPFVFHLEELSGKTIGIIGFGNIAKAVAKIAIAFGMKVLVYTRTPKEAENIEFVSFDELLRRSDVVSVHCPLNDQSYRMFNAQSFAKFKDGAFFINTARGGVMDEVALRDALESGKLSGAAIDVLEYEPMRPDCALLGAKNCIITPHIAWAPLQTRLRLLDIVADNIKAFLDGNPINVVN